MSESTKSIMEELYNATLKKFSEGEIVPGKIVAKNDNEVVVDIGFKSEGFISIEEFRSPAEVQIGQTLEVLIESIEDEEGRLVLSYGKAEKQKGWQKIVDLINEGDTVEGRVVRVVKGGYIVDVSGVEAFLPMSLSSFKGMGQYAITSQSWKFVVAKMNKQRRNLILSRREMVQKENDENRKHLWGRIEKGQRMTGVVKGITDFGAFIDLGGVDGLLHITDMSWSRISHPSEIVSLGQRLEIIILDFDRENSKVSLGLKQIQSNPWDQVYDKYPVGTVVKGRVVNIMPYGVFVEITKGIEGLLHASEITWQKKTVNPQEMFTVGQELEVQIINLDKDSKRISLSLKQLEDNPWLKAEEKFPLNSRVKGKVRGFADYGAFIELPHGLEGMIHVSDMSWTRKVNHPQDVLQKGQDVEVIVLAIDVAARKITLGLKQAQSNPWVEIAARYPVDTVVEAKVITNSNFGVFVKFNDDVEALVYSSEIDKDKAAQLKAGDVIPVKVIKVDVEQMKIGVSARV